MSAQTNPIAPARVVLERGPHHQVVEMDRAVIDAAGKPMTEKARYTVLATGMHYASTNGAWLETEEVVEPHPRGAIAAKGPHRVFFHPTLHTAGAVEITLRDGQRLRAAVLILAVVVAGWRCTVSLAG